MNEYYQCSNKHEGNKREGRNIEHIKRTNGSVNRNVFTCALIENTHFKHSKLVFDDIEDGHNGVNNGSNVSIQLSIVILLSVLYVPMFSMYNKRWVQ